ncbi:hypothetical protein [Dapis sp. BLCC M229]
MNARKVCVLVGVVLTDVKLAVENKLQTLVSGCQGSRKLDSKAQI